jgi:hypothetical protein
MFTKIQSRNRLSLFCPATLTRFTGHAMRFISNLFERPKVPERRADSQAININVLKLKADRYQDHVETDNVGGGGEKEVGRLVPQNC